MFPIKTYADMADETYSAHMGWTLKQRRDWSRLEVKDSNTVGKDYLRLVISFNAIKHPDFARTIGGRIYSGIRLHRGQVKRLIKALQEFLKESEANK